MNEKNGDARDSLAEFFASMNELVAPWVVSIYYGYALERAVSRELGVPCVVGTKVATRVVKTGDRIEVDANSGVVRRL